MAYITIDPIDQYLAYNGGTASYTVNYSDVTNLNVVIDQESDFIPTANLSGNTLTLTYNTTNTTFDQLTCSFTVAGTGPNQSTIYANGTLVQKGKPGTITAVYSADNQTTYLPYQGCTIIYDVVGDHVDLSTVGTTWQQSDWAFNVQSTTVSYDSTNNQVLFQYIGDPKEIMYSHTAEMLPDFYVTDYQGDIIKCLPKYNDSRFIAIVRNFKLLTEDLNDVFIVPSNATSVDISTRVDTESGWNASFSTSNIEGNLTITGCSTSADYKTATLTFDQNNGSSTRIATLDLVYTWSCQRDGITNQTTSKKVKVIQLGTDPMITSPYFDINWGEDPTAGETWYAWTELTSANIDWTNYGIWTEYGSGAGITSCEALFYDPFEEKAYIEPKYLKVTASQYTTNSIVEVPITINVSPLAGGVVDRRTVLTSTSVIFRRINISSSIYPANKIYIGSGSKRFAFPSHFENRFTEFASTGSNNLAICLYSGNVTGSSGFANSYGYETFITLSSTNMSGSPTGEGFITINNIISAYNSKIYPVRSRTFVEIDTTKSHSYSTYLTDVENASSATIGTPSSSAIFSYDPGAEITVTMDPDHTVSWLTSIVLKPWSSNPTSYYLCYNLAAVSNTNLEPLYTVLNVTKNGVLQEKLWIYREWTPTITVTPNPQHISFREVENTFTISATPFLANWGQYYFSYAPYEMFISKSCVKTSTNSTDTFVVTSKTVENTTGQTITGYYKHYNGETHYSVEQTYGTFYKDPELPSITITPATQTVDSITTTATYDVEITGLVNISTSVSGIQGATVTLTPLTRYDYELTVTVPVNQLPSTRSATITISGTNEGTTYRGSATLVQTGTPLYISPVTQIVNGTVAQFNVYCNNCTPTSVISTGDIVVNSYRYEYSAIVDGATRYNLYLTLATNDTDNVISSIIEPVGESSGEPVTSTNSAVLQQRPFSGIEIIPTSALFPAAGGTIEFTINTSRVDLSTMTITVRDSDISSINCSLNGQKNKLIVECGGSQSAVLTSAMVTVSVDDFYGETRSASVLVEQTAADAYVALTPNEQNVAYNSGFAYLDVSTYLISSWTVLSHSGNMNIDSIVEDHNENKITISYGSNDTAYDYSEEIVVRGTVTGTGDYVVGVAIINQAPGIISSIYPIWKPITIDDYPTDSFVEYHIDADGSMIYGGKAYKYPGENVVRFEINDIVSNYIKNGIVFEDGIHKIPNYCKSFSVVTSTGRTAYETVYNSWAYEDTDYWLSDPIDYKISCKQWFPVSFLSTNHSTVNIGGTYYTASNVDDGWTVMKDLSQAVVGDEIVVYGADSTTRRYKVTDADYVLYYANAYGGWDSLLCNGTSKKTDNIESLNYRRKSHSAREFSKVDYQKNITPTWSLNTGIIKNGEKMYHLLESTMVYLHDLKSDEIIPVVITNSTCDYLNYTNNGKQPVKYNITVEESNQKMRK